MGQDRQDQLILVDDVIVASATSGAVVRMFSRYSGKQILPGGKESTTGTALTLPQQGRVSRTHLVPAEPYVYAHNQQAIRASISSAMNPRTTPAQRSGEPQGRHSRDAAPRCL